MSYHIEGSDIVIDGFSGGIADSPYTGISDMRNIECVSIPGEASVGFSTTNTQPLVTSVVFTADSTTDFLTWSGTTTSGTFANQTAITVSNSGGALPTGLSANTTYYVINKTSTTFQVATTPGGSAINITGNGSGTNTFSTINIGFSKYMCTNVSPFASYSYFMIDDNNRAWWWNGTLWVFLNNATSGVIFTGSGIVAWKGYLFIFYDSRIDYLKIPDGTLDTSLWHTNWKTTTAGVAIHQSILSGTNDFVYFCNGTTVGSWFEVAGQIFDPGNTNTYEYTTNALQLPSSEYAQCLGQQGDGNILVGGIKNIVYSWDQLSSGTTPILIPENNTTRIVGTNTNAYIFAGDRGRIYITNGSQAQLFKKVPDHLSGVPSPLFTWGDATFSRNQLYFGVSATDSAGNILNQYGGLWSLDLDSKAIRMSNELTYSNYSGRATAIQAILGSNVGLGSGLFIGWFQSVGGITYGVDKTTSTLYTGGQSIVDSDLIPIGTILDPFTSTQFEWKTSVPIGANGTSETVALYYMTNQSDTPHLIGTTTSANGLLTSGLPALSDNYVSDFQQVQWLKIRAVLTSNATTPTYCRLTQMRIRNFPNGNQSPSIPNHPPT